LPFGHDHRPGVLCPVCEAAKAEKLEPKKFGLLYFKQAVELWLKEHAVDISPKQLKDYGYMRTPLIAFFGEFPLTEIHIGHVQSYVDMRLQMPRRVFNPAQQALPGVLPLTFGKLVGPNSVRKEVSMLRQVMARAGLWDEIGKDYKPPKMPKPTVGRALEDTEQTRLFTVACSNRRWERAYLGSLISAQTTSDHGEIRHLHLNDINLAQQTMRIRDGLKNEHRDRIVELKELPDAYWALSRILKRYYRICRRLKVQPDGEHYILPGRTRGSGKPYDLGKPMGSWRSAWEALTEKAGLPGLRMKDLRHHALTKLLENPELSERTIIEIAGHVNKAMWATYSHIRRKPKQEAMKTLSFPRPAVPLVNPVETVEEVDIAAALGANSTETKIAKKG